MKFQTKKKTTTVVKGSKLTLKLVKDDDGINVYAIDEEGLEQVLIGFAWDGKLVRYGCIDEEMGFDLNSEGKIVIKGD